MHRPNQLVNTDSLEWANHTRKGPLNFRSKALARAIGGKQLGASLYEVPPGQRLWTYHYANE